MENTVDIKHKLTYESDTTELDASIAKLERITELLKEIQELSSGLFGNYRISGITETTYEKTSSIIGKISNDKDKFK